MTTYTVHQAKTHLSQLLARAERGEEVVIARGAEPVVRLTPVKTPPDRKPGAYKGQFTIPDGFFDPLSEEELALWERDL